MNFGIWLRRLGCRELLIFGLMTACHSHVQTAAAPSPGTPNSSADETEREKELRTQFRSIRELINQEKFDQASEAVEALKRKRTEGARERQQLVDLDAT